MGGIHIRLGDAEVDFDGLHICMAQDFLECPGVGAAVGDAIAEKGDGKGMAEAVAADVLHACAGSDPG